jgi:hypothetical protein
MLPAEISQDSLNVALEIEICIQMTTRHHLREIYHGYLLYLVLLRGIHPPLSYIR